MQITVTAREFIYEYLGRKWQNSDVQHDEPDKHLLWCIAARNTRWMRHQNVCTETHRWYTACKLYHPKYCLLVWRTVSIYNKVGLHKVKKPKLAKVNITKEASRRRRSNILFRCATLLRKHWSELNTAEHDYTTTHCKDILVADRTGHYRRQL